jgi:hypothetical protein
MTFTIQKSKGEKQIVKEKCEFLMSLNIFRIFLISPSII